MARNYRHLCEIGASFGENTDKILGIDSVEISIIDPCLDSDLLEKYRLQKRVQLYRGTSLEVLKKIAGPFDCILMDGDHNWYTVYNELRIIHQRNLLKPGGTIFFHDVDWPYARRDMYYQPSLIPKEYTHPYAKKGIIRGKSELDDTAKANAELYNALHEGGPKNGVLTGIEDFWKENRDQYKFFRIQKENGLGILLKKDNSWGSVAFNALFMKEKARNFAKKIKKAVGI